MPLCSTRTKKEFQGSEKVLSSRRDLEKAVLAKIKDLKENNAFTPGASRERKGYRQGKWSTRIRGAVLPVRTRNENGEVTETEGNGGGGIHRAAGG